MINTYNETDLHKFFKEKYATENQGFTEVKVKNYICDIFTEDSSIIEIQTGSLYKLVPKVQDLSPDYKIKIVFPFPFEKAIPPNRSSCRIIPIDILWPITRYA